MSSPNDSPPRDRAFAPYRIPTTDEARQLVAEVLSRLQESDDRRRRRKSEAQAIHERATSALVCDLAYRSLGEPEGWLTVELTKALLSPSKRRAPFMTEQFASLVKAFAACGLVDMELGDSHVLGRRTTIRASNALQHRIAELEIDFDSFGRDPAFKGDPLELRGPKTKQFIAGKVVFKADKLPLPATAEVEHVRRQMEEINAWLAEADLSWQGSKKLDPSLRFLKRIFNNGSMELGGRLDGGFWQQAPSNQRCTGILIDREPIASLDFAQSAMRMAYAQMGAEPPEGDLYNVPGLFPWRRETKQILNALMSADSERTRFPKNSRGDIPRSWKFEEVYRFIARHHAAIEPLFGTGAGLRFMYQESEILIRVLLRLKAEEIVALPIHDCVLVPSSAKDIAKEAMEACFLEVTGIQGVVEIEERAMGSSKDHSGEDL